MKLRLVTCALVLLALTALATTTEAQNIGFGVAIAPHPQQPTPTVRPATAVPSANAITPVQPFVTAPVQQFGFGQVPVSGFGFGTPGFGFGTPQMVPPVISTHPSNFSPFPGFPQQFQQQFQQQFPPQAIAQPYFSNGVANNGITVIVPNGTVVTNSTVIYQQPASQTYTTWPQTAPPPAFTPPSVGMPRAQVIQQFGTPLTTVITQSGETLFFNGGVQIFIQNGKVALPN